MLVEIKEVLKYIVDDKLVRSMKWTKTLSDSELKMSGFTIFKEAFLDAFSVDLATLTTEMVKATQYARARDRTKESQQKKRKISDI